MLADVSAGPAAHCFVCGPTAFVEPLNDLLVAGGHSPRDGIADVAGEVAGAEMSAVLRTCQSLRRPPGDR